MVKFSLALSPDIRSEQLLEIVRMAESKRYEIVFVTDEGLCRSAYAILGMCAICTKKIKLGIGVTNPYTRNPGLIAAAIATIDEASNGRVLLGLGAGSTSNLGGFGIEQKRPIPTLREAVIVIRKLFQGQTVTSRKEGFELHAAKLDFSPNQIPPIYIAGRGPRILQLAGEIGDGAIAGGGLVSGDGMKYAYENIQMGMREADRNTKQLDIICWAFCSIANNEEVARDSVRPIIARILSDVPARTLIRIGMNKEKIMRIKYQRAHLDRLSKEKLRSLVTNDLLDQFSIVGSPENCLKTIKNLVHTGVNHIAILPIENSEMGMEEIAREFNDSVIRRI